MGAQKNSSSRQNKFAVFVKTRPGLFSVYAFASAIVIAAVIYGGIYFFSVQKPLGASQPRLPLVNVFGELFGINTKVGEWQEASVMEGSRPQENMEIPFEETKLSRAFDMLDKRHLFIKGTSYSLAETGYVKVDRIYAFKDNSVYIMLDNGKDDYHFISNAELVVGLDFEKLTYTEVSPIPYSIDELLYTSGYTTCTSVGKDLFFGENTQYEDFTYYSSNSTIEWIRYFFNDGEGLLGYVRYVNNDIVEMMKYDYIGSDYPEDAVVYFSIPDGFTKEDIYIEWSDIFGNE